MPTAMICMRLMGAFEINCRGSEFTELFPPELNFPRISAAKYHHRFPRCSR